MITICFIKQNLHDNENFKLQYEAKQWLIKFRVSMMSKP